jgi:hypothetical protein
MRPPLLPLLALVACSKAPVEVATTTTTTTPPSTTTTTTTPPPKADLALLWNDPPMFLRSKPKTPARAAEYVIPRVGKDPEDAECVVMTFGPHQGGTVDENVKRWVDQFHPALPTPRRMNIDINGMHTTFLEVTGTFAGNMMPGRQSVATPTEKPGWRLIGAIVEAPAGLWFFKLTGPEQTVRAAAHQFEDMIHSVRPR